MRTLRSRLILSHVLPLIVIIPLMGITLVYLLETQVMLDNLSHELTGEAVLVAQIATDHPEIWNDSAEARAFAARLDQLLSVHVALFTPDAYLLTSSDPADAGHEGEQMVLPDLSSVLSGNMAVRIAYGGAPDTQIANVLVPVDSASNQVVGVIRLTQQSANVYERFARLRVMSVAVLAVGLVLGVAAGWLLALQLERPLHQATQAIQQLVETGLKPGSSLPEHGPEEVRTLLQAFNTLSERLRTLQESRSRLLANLVHELGRPLGALLSAIQALRGGADEEAELRQSLLVGMEAEVQRLRRLLADLSHLYDQMVGTLELSRRPTPLGDWLAQTLSLWREAAQRKGLRWESDLPELLPAVNMDPDRLAQALGNLLSNAIKYTPAGGAISVAATTGDGRVKICVCDTGPGITPADQSRLFTPFFRGRTTTRFPQGMGLGLAIARDLVEAHQGSLTVESTPGQGSRFTIELPL